MSAPDKFARWLSSYSKVDKHGRRYAYHPRSDAHSVEISYLVLEDLIGQCSSLRSQGRAGKVAFGINVPHTWGTKTKTLDLAIGRPAVLDKHEKRITSVPRALEFAEVFVACEAKAVMTEHSKSQPRVFDELSSSYGMVHKGRGDAIAAGITVVNIATTFISPTRNQIPGAKLYVSKHRQPDVTARMVGHLRGLVIRESREGIGFDAYCTLVVDCDNQGHAGLWSKPPAPQEGDSDHYDTFIGRLAKFYDERFGEDL